MDQQDASGTSRRSLLSMIGKVAGSAAMYHAMTELGYAGESTFKLQWDATQNATLMSMFRQKKGFRITYADAPYPSGSKLRFNGWINGIEGETIQKDNVVEASISIRVVGKPDFQAAS